MPASRATWRAETRAPWGSTVVPAATSAARRRTFSPARTAASTRTRILPRSVSIHGTTASAPSGSGAPESTSMAVPGTSRVGRMSPARTASLTSKVTGVAPPAPDRSAPTTA